MTVSVCYIVIGTVLKHSLAKNKTKQQQQKSPRNVEPRLYYSSQTPVKKNGVFDKRKEQMTEKTR